MKELNCESVLNQVTDSMVIIDSEDKIVFINKGAERYQHLARAAFKTGTSLIDLVSAERKEIVSTILKQVKNNKKPQTTEAEYKDARGNSFFFEITYNPIITESKELEHICVVFHEITHLKTFERRSVQLIKELSSLIENANALIFSVDSREYITEWNRECTRVSGHEKNEVLAQKVHNHLDERCHLNFKFLMEKVLTGESMSNQELIVKTKNHETITLLVNATPKLNSANNVVGVLLVGQDVTELSQYRQSLEEKVKDRTEKLKQALEKEKELVDLKNRFVSVASHEFRIPLSAIIAYVKGLKTNTHLRKKDIQNITSIENQVAHMRKLLDDILTVKKGETNVLKVSYASIDIVEFVNRLIEEALENAQHSHYVRTEFSHPTIQMDSDEKLLRNIFLNIISNAIKFSPASEEVLVTITDTNGEVAIAVQDKGIGITENDRHKIFEPFHRGSNVADIKGTGLGLYIVKKAVDTLKGKLEIDSAERKGTTITVKLNKSTNFL